nr:inactive protein kinase SELMODRAFT_444075-like [Tanacetum cinerariifolium]
MSTRPDKWMVIHDASRDDGLKAIILAFESLPIRSGDELTLLGVINLHPSPRVGSNNKSKEDEHMRKQEYLKREEVIQLSDICANKKIIFEIDVQATSSPKTVAALAAKVLMVNWVVLDRQMKKDKKYFMDKLTCGILRMKRDNTIEKLRGPIIREDKNLQSGKRTKSSEHVSYGEMIPVMSKQAVAQIKTLSPQKATNLLRKEEGTHRLLVYEFVCYGSLDQHLSSPDLTWNKRIKIALGAARGLEYLHRKNIIHRDMRPNNILVTHDYEPLVDVEEIDADGGDELLSPFL